MRMTGFASGMEIDQIVKDLMRAERQPLEKMEQDQRFTELKRDAYREANTKMSELDNMFLDMRMSTSYQSSSVDSTNPGAVSASAPSNAEESYYSVGVEQLANKAVNASDGRAFDAEFNADEASAELEGQTVEFSYFNENGEQQDVSFEVASGESLNDVFDRISEESNGAVSGFYDANSGRVFIERTESGSFNENGPEIMFADDSIFANQFQLNQDNEVGGDNALFTYNGIQMESRSNEYEIDGVNFQFNNTTGDSPAVVSVQHDVDDSVDKIMEFVEKYNEVIEHLNDKTNEERFRDYPPLTQEQRNAMSDNEIELWEERSQSGLLRRDGIINNGLSSMRSSWYQQVDNTAGDFRSVIDVGITTSSNWRDGGKLEVDEDKLRTALQDDSEGVFRIFSNNVEGESRGVINRVEDALSNTMDRITDRAGNELRTEHQYTMGRELISMSDRMENFERRMQQVESRYWDQFNRMERAIQEMNNQSMQMQQQLGQMG